MAIPRCLCNPNRLSRNDGIRWVHNDRLVAFDLGAEMHRQTNVENGVSRGLDYGPVFEFWSQVENVVTLPVTWLAAGIYQRRKGAVDRGGLPVGIGVVW